MKPAPTKFSTSKLSTNQRVGNYLSEQQEQRNKAIETAKLFHTLPHLQNKPIIYDINRKP